MTIELAELEHPPGGTEHSASRRSARSAAGGCCSASWSSCGSCWARLLQGKGTQDLPVRSSTDFQLWLNEHPRLGRAGQVRRQPPLPAVRVDQRGLQLDRRRSCRELFVDPTLTTARCRGDRLGRCRGARHVGGLAIAGVSHRAARRWRVVLSFGWLGYWEDTVDTLIITGVSVAVCVLHRHPARDLDEPQQAGHSSTHAGARRHADDAIVRLPGSAGARSSASARLRRSSPP